MKTSAILILSMAVLIGSPDASAQSFKERLKNAVKKEVQELSGKTSKKQKDKASGVTTNSQKGKNVIPVVTGRVTKEEAATVLFGKDHTALFAPTGEPAPQEYGIKSVTVSKPPKEESKHPAWNESRPSLYELDNKSLVDEYLLLDECMESNYVSHSGPIAVRYWAVDGELSNRMKRLEELVENYNEAIDAYMDFTGQEEDEWVFEGFFNTLYNRVLGSREYHTLIRSSLAPFFNKSLASFFNHDDNVLEYFDAHGGYENAHKAKWTVLKAPKTNK